MFCTDQIAKGVAVSIFTPKMPFKFLSSNKTYFFMHKFSNFYAINKFTMYFIMRCPFLKYDIYAATSKAIGYLLYILCCIALVDCFTCITPPLRVRSIQHYPINSFDTNHRNTAVM